jgi:hypothetical protein
MRQQRNEEFVELPPVVRDALDALKPVPEADPVVWEQNRIAYLAAALKDSVTSRTMVPLGAETDGSPGHATDRHGWRAALSELLSFRVREVRPMTVALRLVLMVALLLGASAGTVAAAQDSLPGSVLYPLKVQLEHWEIARASDAFALSERALSQSQTRLWEANQLADKGKTVPEDLAARYQHQLGVAIQASGTLTEPLRLQAQSHISETLQHHVRTMAEIAAKVSNQGEDPAIQAMIRTMQETQAQLGAGIGREGAVGQGDPTQAGPAAGEQVQTGPGEANEDGEGYGPGEASPDDEDWPYGPGFGQTDQDDGSGSVNGPDNDRGQNGENQKNNNSGGGGNR